MMRKCLLIRWEKAYGRALKILLKASLLLVAGPVVSCSSTSSDSSLSFTASVQQVVLINASTFSCTALAQTTVGTAPTSDVSSNFFQIPQITISWTKVSSPFSLIWVAIYLKSSDLTGGTASCQIAASDLMYAWVGANYCPTGALTGGGTNCVSSQNPVIYYNSSALPATTSARSASTIYTSNQCSLSCGAIKVKDPSKTIQGVGSVYIYGTYSDGSILKSATSQIPITFSYQGAGPAPASSGF
jgi:hypothetical protein